MTTETRPAVVAPPIASSDPLDPAKLKADFPILDQEVFGHRLVYLDSAAT